MGRLSGERVLRNESSMLQVTLQEHAAVRWLLRRMQTPPKLPILDTTTPCHAAQHRYASDLLPQRSNPAPPAVLKAAAPAAVAAAAGAAGRPPSVVATRPPAKLGATLPLPFTRQRSAAAAAAKPQRRAQQVSVAPGCAGRASSGGAAGSAPRIARPAVLPQLSACSASLPGWAAPAAEECAAPGAAAVGCPAAVAATRVSRHLWPQGPQRAKAMWCAWAAAVVRLRKTGGAHPSSRTGGGCRAAARQRAAASTAAGGRGGGHLSLLHGRQLLLALLFCLLLIQRLREDRANGAGLATQRQPAPLMRCMAPVPYLDSPWVSCRWACTFTRSPPWISWLGQYNSCLPEQPTFFSLRNMACFFSSSSLTCSSAARMPSSAWAACGSSAGAARLAIATAVGT